MSIVKCDICRVARGVLFADGYWTCAACKEALLAKYNAEAAGEADPTRRPPMRTAARLGARAIARAASLALLAVIESLAGFLEHAA